MKIASYTHNREESYGVITKDGIVDLRQRIGESYPNLLSILREQGISEADNASKGMKADFPIEAVEFLPLIPAPVNVFCAGINYMDHVIETGNEPPDVPVLFMKIQQSLVGHGNPIIRPNVSVQFDYEAELCVIIGQRGRNIPINDALSYVAGYTCLMDGSVRDFQKIAVDQGKNFYHSSSVGPWMVTPDELPDTSEMHIEGRLNGQVMQHSTIDQLIHKVDYLISYYSQIAELQPGDMISTGTCGGVGHRRTPPVYMKGGDVFEVEISGIGILRNPVIEE
jgi:2-keto-4-pentenoate hydratase/2-oxohepta-3-ene-1,7-dioic acid hydratase in catechol pathway|tara:strand:- start:814 stop:1656 length:843 start_codon:yes stop_codon:yes gene_type:complete